eukprot:565924-Rhodomonas_salina.1
MFATSCTPTGATSEVYLSAPPSIVNSVCVRRNTRKVSRGFLLKCSMSFSASTPSTSDAACRK